jgi:hypothetical protein
MLRLLQTRGFSSMVPVVAGYVRKYSARNAELHAKDKADDQQQAAIEAAWPAAEEPFAPGRSQSLHEPTPFVRGKPDAHDIDPNDVRQGMLVGDCSFLAAAMSVVRQHPERIRDLIKPNGDGTYDVTLYVRESWWSTHQIPRVFRVTPRFSVLGATPSDIDERTEIWPLILEKAFAMYRGSYDAARGGIDDMLDLLSPEGSSLHYTDRLLNWGHDPLAQIGAAWQDGLAITVSSLAEKDLEERPGAFARARELHLALHHAYSVSGFDATKRTISLANPWGRDHLPDLSFDDFAALFKNIAIERAPEA